MKLPAKAVFCYLIAVCAIFIIVNVSGMRAIKKTVLSQLKNDYSVKTEEIADQCGEYFYRPEASLEGIRAQLEIADRLIDARIWFANVKGVVVIDTRSYTLTDVSVYDPGFFDFSYREDVTLSGVFPEPMLCFREAVISGFAVKGYLCVLVPMSRITLRATEYMNVINLALVVVSGVLLVAFTVIYMVFAYPTRRIRKAALEYAKGNYDYKLNITSHDEIRDLADSITYMVGEVKNADDYQKKFIANISHDFRSPLTSIKGYAEAMKDGTIPYELQDKYLNIILFEAERLTKLTTNLLDLTRMDNKGVMLDITTFDINQVIKDVAAAFEGTCREKKIVINLEFAELQTYVDADMGRIQQVLYNLTDNAIKFSGSDSSIEIETEEKGSKVLVRVRDHGVGIPKDSIKKIWERFYKTDSSRGRDKRGTGLGLSIVKEVITAHDENISVISTEGVGTEFTFTLAHSEV